MRFVKGNKKVPFYESKKSAVKGKDFSTGGKDESFETVAINSSDSSPQSALKSNDKSKYIGKPGSVTDVLSFVKNDQITGDGATVTIIDDENPRDLKEQLDNSNNQTTPVSSSTSVFSAKLKELDEMAPLPQIKQRKAQKKRATGKQNSNRPRAAIISAVTGLALFIIAASVYGFFYFNGYNPLNLLNTAAPTVTTAAVVETQSSRPVGSPVIEYSLLSTTTGNTSQSLELSLASAEDLLEIRVTDSNGQLATELPLTVTIIDPDENSSTYDIGDSGSLELDGLEIEGRYAVILHPVDGYPVIEPKFIEVVINLDTTPLDEDALKEIIKDESEIDVSTEDSLYSGPSTGDGDGTSPPPATVVTPVPSDKDGTTETIGAETYYLPKNGEKTFTISNGEYAGDYVFTLDGNGRIVGAVKVVTVAANVETNSVLSVLSSLFINTTDAPQTDTVPTTSVTSIPSSVSTSSEISSSLSVSSSVSTPSSTSPSSSSTSSPSSGGSDSDDSDEEPVNPPTATEAVPESVLFNSSGGTLLMREPFSNYAVKYESAGETIYYGWHTINGDEYYYDMNGNVITGYVSINGIFYTFTSDGKLQKSITDGIDVSKYQPNVDWNAVKASGIDFVIIRVGYRGYSTGALVEDPYYRSHIDGATKAGLKVGIYIYSQAITVQEAIEEASFCLELSKGYNLEYGITFDTEYEANNGRANNISTALRTQIANTFCDTVRNGGRVPMIYSNMSWMLNQLDYTAIDHNRIWMAHYTAQTTFPYRYDIWQYTSTGNVAGIPGNCDMNFSYIIP